MKRLATSAALGALLATGVTLTAMAQVPPAYPTGPAPAYSPYVPQDQSARLPYSGTSAMPAQIAPAPPLSVYDQEQEERTNLERRLGIGG